MRKKDEIVNELSELVNDTLLDEKATLSENAPLAFMQVELEAKISMLLWVLGEKGGTLEELRERYPERQGGNHE